MFVCSCVRVRVFVFVCVCVCARVSMANTARATFVIGPGGTGGPGGRKKHKWQSHLPVDLVIRDLEAGRASQVLHIATLYMDAFKLILHDMVLVLLFLQSW